MTNLEESVFNGRGKRSEHTKDGRALPEKSTDARLQRKEILQEKTGGLLERGPWLKVGGSETSLLLGRVSRRKDTGRRRRNRCLQEGGHWSMSSVRMETEQGKITTLGK